MRRFTTLTGITVPFGRANVDTDLIIPSRYLKTITRTGLGAGGFAELREDPDDVFDQARNRGPPILTAGANFGCGSSREHAAWALADMGFRAIIAPSFTDIFAGNAAKHGILLVVLPQDQVDHLLALTGEGEVTVDLPDQVVAAPDGAAFAFPIDPFFKHCLVNGLDEIDLTLAMDGDIAATNRISARFGAGCSARRVEVGLGRGASASHDMAGGEACS